MKTTMCIESIAARASQLETSMSHGKACFLACREAGVEEMEVASTASVISSVVTNHALRFQPRIASDRERLKLRGRDRIEGDEVVIVFKRGREVRLARREWITVVSENHEPHAVVALR
jgi:hypothetical protein